MTKIACSLCSEEVHSIQIHLRDKHADDNISLDAYQTMFPGAPIFSPMALEQIAKRRIEAGSSKTQMAGTAAQNVTPISSLVKTVYLHDHFGLGSAKAAMNANGEPIPIKVHTPGDWSEMVPEVDDNYVYSIDLLKTALMGIELNINTYLWGHAGTGKTTLFEQICARTNRPMLRVQHTANMIESDVLGQWTVKGGETVFELGPLARAMKYGWVYLADEYDFAYAQVLGVYQPVLEGKALVIKDADPEHRIIKPHPNFRFVATGNTNGSGDETGLYQGTNIQNAANYSRFGITEQVKYMDDTIETLIVRKQAGVTEQDARLLILWATELRKAYDSCKISSTVGPRELINSGKVGALKRSMREGVRLAVTNRMTSVDRQIADDLAQRYLGT